MHSWLYRNRKRLGLIYGRAPLALPAPVEVPVEVPVEASVEALLEHVAEATPPPPLPANAGVVIRRRRYVLLKPMPPRAS